MQDYQKLRVWKKAYDLVLEIYVITKIFPKEELYGITSQIKGRQRLSPRISLKDAEEEQKPTYVGFS